MSETLTNGVIVPDKGSRDWYADLRSNWLKLDSLMAGGNITINPAQTEGVLVATITVGGKEYKLYQQDGDVSVKIDPSAENAEYPLVASTSAEANTGSVVMAPAVTVNPSTGAVTATSFKGKLDGNASTATNATKAVQDGAGAVITDTYATKSELGSKANDADVVHKSGTETIVGTKTFSSQIKGNISGTSSDVVVGSDTATARGYLVDNNLPWYTWEEGSQLIAGRVPLITDFNNLIKPGVYHVIFCLNDGFVHEEKEYKESLNRPSIPNITTGFRDGILEIKETTTMYNISSCPRFTQKLTLLSSNTNHGFNGRTYQRVCVNLSNNNWTAWKRVAIDEEVVHTSGNETIAGIKSFTGNTSTIIKLKNERMVNGQDDTVNRFWSIILTDKNNKDSARIIRFINADNTSAYLLYDYYKGDSTNQVKMGPGHTKDGQGFVCWDAGIRNNTYPSTDNTYTLGTSTLKWKAVYANSVVVNGENVLTDANQIMLAKNLSGTNVAPGGVVDCGNGNGKLKLWYLGADGTFVLANTLPTGVWKSASFVTLAPNEGGMFIKIG